MKEVRYIIIGETRVTVGHCKAGKARAGRWSSSRLLLAANGHLQRRDQWKPWEHFLTKRPPFNINNLPRVNLPQSPFNLFSEMHPPWASLPHRPVILEDRPMDAIRLDNGLKATTCRSLFATVSETHILTLLQTKSQKFRGVCPALTMPLLWGSVFRMLMEEVGVEMWFMDLWSWDFTCTFLSDHRVLRFECYAQIYFRNWDTSVVACYIWCNSKVSVLSLNLPRLQGSPTPFLPINEQATANILI